MKQLLNAFFFALSYFSIIPVFVKNMEINNETYKYTLALLPLVGAILLIIALVTDSQPGSNQWGPNPKETDDSINEIGNDLIERY